MKSGKPGRFEYCLIYFGFCLGLVMIVSGVYQSLMGTLSKSWPSTQGRSNWRSKNNWTYDYSVNGVSYSNNRVQYGGLRPKGTLSQRRYLEQLYPEDKPLQVYYWPSHPAFAVLKPGPGKNIWIFFLSGVFFCTFTGVQWYFWKAKNSRPD